MAEMTFVVTQSGAAPECSSTVSPRAVTVPVAGGAGSLTVTAGAGCAWNAESSAAWLMVTSGNAGRGSETVTYDVAPNTAPVVRSATVTVAGQSHMVTQEALVEINPVSNVSRTQKIWVWSDGNGYQELIYNYTTTATVISPYADSPMSFDYALPAGEWIGIFHYSYGESRFSEAIYTMKE